MAWLILGLVLFVGVHSVRIVADGWRTHTIARMGAKTWKGVYTAVSLVGFALIVWGYGQARQHPVLVWQPPVALRHMSALLVLLALVLVAAAYVPRNVFKARVGHPMLLGTKVWALAHLLSTRTLGAMVLFGAFLIWAALAFRAARQRDRAAGVVYPAATFAGTSGAVAVGVALWAVMAFWAHGALIGVRPFG